MLLNEMYVNLFCSYVIVFNKGYQEFDDVVSGTTTKLKGIAQTNYTALNISGPGGIDYRIWDVADYVVPPQASVNIQQFTFQILQSLYFVAY